MKLTAPDGEHADVTGLLASSEQVKTRRCEGRLPSASGSPAPSLRCRGIARVYLVRDEKGWAVVALDVSR